ncbi:hypothetical protein K2Z84_19155 [Candidatus Binatia bacterium]|nr:hypothetical protein [Candidatus Binatia bacterium]
MLPLLRFSLLVALSLSLGASGCSDAPETSATALRVGVAAVPITPCGDDPDWDGTTTQSGVWGELYDDANGNGRYDAGESFTDDPANDALDPQSKGKYDGIYMAGFGADRIALGCHDDLWARALVLDDGTTRIALTAVDLVGTLKYGSYYGFAHAEALVDPALGIDHFFYASTHDHQGPDALGLWGPDTLVDGKYPRYLTFVDRQVARAISQAASALVPVHAVRAYRTDPDQSPELRGLQVRTGCRPPWIFDSELRAIAFEGASGTVATLLNWGTHPESLESENQLITSDFPHYVRDEVERRLGGTAVYVSADLGAAEIVGDTCVGGADARNPDGSNELDSRDHVGFARTETIGRIVGGVAAAGLAGAPTVDAAALDVRTASTRATSSNATFELGRSLGLLDVDAKIYDPAQCPGGAGLCALLEQAAITIADRSGKPQIQLVTVPGEIFPELYLGVATHRRTDCPAADTGRPAEPSIRDAMSAPFKLVVGLSPDELGYVVPGYDFYPANVFDEQKDPCDGQPYDALHPRRRVPTHYHEVLSLGVETASYVTCTAVELLRGEGATEDEPACRALR